MARKKGLGRGLDALLPGGDISASGGYKTEDGDFGNRIIGEQRGDGSQKLSINQTLKEGSVIQIAIDRLIPDPGQPRKYFDETEMRELADSITEYGIIQPIIVRDAGHGSFIITAGERRFRAAALAGLNEIPVIVREYAEEKRQGISLIENIQRSDLNPIEEAMAYKNMMDSEKLSQEELAAKVGKPRPTITNALRLLKLSSEIQESIKLGDKKGGISPGHARALLSVTDKKLREKLFIEITGKGLSVREAEKRAAIININPVTESEALKDKIDVKRPAEITEMEEKFIERLGTKVSIEGGLEKGRIHVDYYSMEDLDRLYGIIGG
jgi:ParB family chromosome partitioning protein